MGIPRVLLLSLTGCIIGLTCALTMQIWMNGIDYKIIIWQAYISLPAFIPVTFELTILFTAFTVFGMFGLNKLPTWHLLQQCLLKASHVFGILYYSTLDNNFDETKTRLFLENAGQKILKEF